MIFIGADPGLTGAIAIISNHEDPVVIDIPTIANGKAKGKVKRMVDSLGLILALEEHTRGRASQITASVERTAAMPGQGVSSMFSMGDTFGAVRTALVASGAAVNFLTPSVWKKHFNIGKEKDLARSLAIQKFPSLHGMLNRVKDHNRAEALLIAEYTRQTHGG